MCVGLLPAALAAWACGVAWGAARGPAERMVMELREPPLYAFLAWEKKASPADGGLRLTAPSGKGGAGFALKADLSAWADASPALTLTVGEGNRAKAVRASIHDADGTEHEYTFKLEGLAPGAAGEAQSTE